MSRGMESEGGTDHGRASEADNAYSAVLNQQQRGCAGLHRGQTVSIAGEPGMHVYKVLAVDPVRGEAVVARVGDPSRSWRLPVKALTAFD